MRRPLWTLPFRVILFPLWKKPELYSAGSRAVNSLSFITLDHLADDFHRDAFTGAYMYCH